MKTLFLLAIAAAAVYYVYTHHLISGADLKKDAQKIEDVAQKAAQDPAAAGKQLGAEAKQLTAQAKKDVQAAEAKEKQLSSDFQQAKKDAQAAEASAKKLKQDAESK